MAFGLTDTDLGWGCLSAMGEQKWGSETQPLREIATVIRSKNAGPFVLTFDILFRDIDQYRRVRDCGIITAAQIARRYQIPVADVLGIVNFDPAQAIKITIRRAKSAGSPGDTDVYGAQQHAPLLDIPIPTRVDSPATA